MLSNQEPSSGRSTTATAPHDVMYGEGRGVNIVLSTKKRTKNLVFLHLVITFEYIYQNQTGLEIITSVLELLKTHTIFLYIYFHITPLLRPFTLRTELKQIFHFL